MPSLVKILFLALALSAFATANVSACLAQVLSWDAYNRLAQVAQRDTGTSDFNWTTVYDGFGRRIFTTLQPMNNGVNNGSASTVTYYYDPQVEFLEIGQLVYNPSNNPTSDRTWRVYGPDKARADNKRTAK